MKDIVICMPPQVDTALNILNRFGFEAYIVGGCVRDSLLGADPKDWDITTPALPEDVKRCFRNHRIIETGLKHGTVTVIISGMPIEITTYRRDGEYKDNRRPDSVDFIDNITMDLERRDFTINAVAYNKRGILDLFEGIGDIESKIIRCVGDPDKRFNEDGLRILRALRFASVLGFEIETGTSDSIHKNRELLKNISPERIAAEFNKLIAGMNLKKVMADYRDIIQVFIPEIKSTEPDNLNESDLSRWHKTLTCMENVPNDLALRLAALFHNLCGREKSGIDVDCSETCAALAFEIMGRLRYDKATSEKVRVFILYHNKKINPDERDVKRWLNKVGEPLLKGIFEIKKAIIKSGLGANEEKLDSIKRTEDVLSRVIAEKQCYNLKMLNLNGDDLLSAELARGAEIGRILNELLHMVIDDEIENDREKLLNYAIKKFKKFS